MKNAANSPSLMVISASAESQDIYKLKFADMSVSFSMYRICVRQYIANKKQNRCLTLKSTAAPVLRTGGRKAVKGLPSVPAKEALAHSQSVKQRHLKALQFQMGYTIHL